MTRRLVMSGALIASLFLSLFVSNNTSAISGWNYISNTTGGMRSYTLQRSSGSYNFYGNGTWQESWNIPSVIFGSVPSGYERAFLNGVVFSANINGGDNSNKYNYIEVIARFEQPPTASGLRQTFNTTIPAYMGYGLSDGTNGQVQCQVGGSDNLAQEWNCKLTTTNYQKITSISIDWGAWKGIPSGTNPTTYYIAGIGFPANTNSISLATWRYRYESTMDPTPAMLQNIDNSINNLNNNIININNSIDDHYNEEKAEENAREQQGQQDSADLSGLFNFSVINPFDALYSAVNANTQCVNIPIIASMLNVQDTQYCNWFPQSVRSILTPVISLTSMMMVFGFLIAWLRQSSVPIFEMVHTDNGNFVSYKGEFGGGKGHI